jgi:hypothetical protein
VCTSAKQKKKKKTMKEQKQETLLPATTVVSVAQRRGIELKRTLEHRRDRTRTNTQENYETNTIEGPDGIKKSKTKGIILTNSDKQGISIKKTESLILSVTTTMTTAFTKKLNDVTPADKKVRTSRSNEKHNKNKSSFFLVHVFLSLPLLRLTRHRQRRCVRPRLLSRQAS